MKFTITSLLIILSFCVNAGTAGKGVSKTCLQHAVSLVDQLKADVFPDMNESQSNEALRLATENCNKYFNNENSNQVKVNTSGNQGKVTAGSEEESSDWFTNYILNGEAADKEGNRRLKNLHK